MAFFLSQKDAVLPPDNKTVDFAFLLTKKIDPKYTMKKILLICAAVFAIGMITGCKGGGMSAEADEATVNVAVNDTTANSDTWSDEWMRLSEKMCNNDTLLPEEWAFLFENIDKADGEYSESMGYCLYKSMQYPRFLENMELEGLTKLSPERREQVLEKMMSMLSIDIMAEKHTYTWAEFSDVFYVFEGSKAAEREFARIIEEKNPLPPYFDYCPREEYHLIIKGALRYDKNNGGSLDSAIREYSSDMIPADSIKKWWYSGE